VETLSDLGEPPKRECAELQPCLPKKQRAERSTARFLQASQITPNAQAFFERRFLPLFAFESSANGVVLPPVIFDRELGEVREALRTARSHGAEYALVGNLGHLSLAREEGLVPVADFRMNLCNRESVALCESLGFEASILSAEMTLPQIRDVGGETATIVYGRIPLMTLEKCVGREVSDCQACALGEACLTDRRGVSFPVVREWKHRSVVLNSLPTSMSDRGAELRRYCVTDRHFLFTVEDPTEVDAVIEAFQREQPTVGVCRRIGTS
jgi:collagenase-like PrtC family protease